MSDIKYYVIHYEVSTGIFLDKSVPTIRLAAVRDVDDFRSFIEQYNRMMKSEDCPVAAMRQLVEPVEIDEVAYSVLSGKDVSIPIIYDWQERNPGGYELINGFDVIMSLGKFEAEPLWLPYLWDIVMNGGGQDIYDESGTPMTLFVVEDGDVEIFPELFNEDIHAVFVWEDGSGFVNQEAMDVDEYNEWETEHETN